jgi:IS30 family transposase
MTYKQLAQEQRYQIYTLLKIGKTEAKIANFLGVHRSTINREIKRNKGKKGYRPKQAQEMAVGRIKRNINRIKAEEWEEVNKRLAFDMSPEQISNDLKKKKIKISHERIYQYIYADKRNGGTLHTHLRCQKKYRKRTGSYDRRGKIPNAVSIEKRPEEIEKRERLGDWEGDTIVGNKHKGAILTLVDRKSGYTLMGQLNKREAQLAADMAVVLLNSVPHVETLTVDNGKEFAKHEDIKNKAKIDVYFAHPYASWERGTNENTNGLIRQYLPKHRRLDNVTDDEISFIMHRLNHRPRKRLDYRTPHEVFFQHQSVALET